MQGEEWAGRQEGGGEEETEKPGNVTVRGNTTVIKLVLITYLKLIGVNIIFHKLIAQVEEERGRDRTRLPPARGGPVCLSFVVVLD